MGTETWTFKEYELKLKIKSLMTKNAFKWTKWMIFLIQNDILKLFISI